MHQQEPILQPPYWYCTSTGLPCHFFAVVTHMHNSNFRATYTLALHCSLIQSVLALVGQSRLSA